MQGLCVAMNVPLPFTVSDASPKVERDKKRMGCHIPAMHVALGLALVLASQESAHPLHLQPESQMCRGSAPALGPIPDLGQVQSGVP